MVKYILKASASQCCFAGLPKGMHINTGFQTIPISVLCFFKFYMFEHLNLHVYIAPCLYNAYKDGRGHQIS